MIGGHRKLERDKVLATEFALADSCIREMDRKGIGLGRLSDAVELSFGY